MCVRGGGGGGGGLHGQWWLFCAPYTVSEPIRLAWVRRKPVSILLLVSLISLDVQSAVYVGGVVYVVASESKNNPS